MFSTLKLIVIALALGFLASCSDSSVDQNTKEALSSFLNDNDKIVGFGNADLKGILNKSDYKNVPKLGKLLNTEMSTLEKLINMEDPVYYALEGPFDVDGTPETAYAFLSVKNSDSLITELTQRGFDFEEKKEMKYCSDGDVSIGIKGPLAVIISKSGDYNRGKALSKAFKKTEGDVSGGKIDDILDVDGDVVLGMNVESLYKTSETDLDNLSDEKKDKLKALVKDSYIQTVMKFEDGAAIIETKNFFSKELRESMFFNSDNKAPIVAKLGQGKPRFGLSVNLDLKKMQNLVNDFSPDAMDELGKAMGGPAQFALMAAGEDGFAGLFDGQFGVVMVGEPDMTEGTIPDFNVFLGLEDRGKSLGSMAKDMMSYGSTEITLNSEGLTASTNPVYASAGSSSLSLPAGCENFGKSGVSAFLNLDGLDIEDWDLEGEAKILKVVKYMTFEYDENGGRLYIKAKKGQENVLKQTMEVIIKEFSSEINNMGI
ncbi:MAG: hypothetical protein MK105_01175 [Crocinitomicaceae bacterium]|nr:hypothetical protein [Crocinitomicaceae bacterium]